MECGLGADDLGHEHLRVADLEGIRAKALQERHAQTHTGVAHDDRLGRAPFLVRPFLHRDEIDFGREGGAVVEGLADEVDKQRDVRGGNGVAAGVEHVERIPIAEEDRRLCFAYDHLRADAIIADGTVVGETVDQFVGHFVRIFDNIKNSSHFSLL